ncbi:hypothetical protein P152DRAFT_470557 [Eremomyces bilateralis CBS 781.70]|uniref:Uncharacterized protein n=1 Tax=Eremomyces bilateralis CBS 781.70 TaxID=1392243 RepID=A0A6G1GER0_9PEZI|nr:uncharacterized protein P152DRAFT_470557 [Eremomyces bilateralis CBS 781.70]KAF1816548.1 hypothetical protein P152DRAFT_470557 [Eremomyces bilateralis CBS 781.70]
MKLLAPLLTSMATLTRLVASVAIDSSTNALQEIAPTNFYPRPGAIYNVTDNSLISLDPTTSIFTSLVSKADDVCTLQSYRCKKQNKTWVWWCRWEDDRENVFCRVCGADGTDPMGEMHCIEDRVRTPQCVDFVYCEDWYTCIGC